MTSRALTWMMMIHLSSSNEGKAWTSERESERGGEGAYRQGA